MNWIFILISSLLSGLLGVGISTWYHHRNEIRRAKLQVLQQLFGNRHDLLGQLFTEAINQVFIVFHDSEDVLSAKGIPRIYFGWSEDHRPHKLKTLGFIQSNVQRS